MPIRVLDAETVGRIAAGEVVERPASIAKELIENSLDARATSITIEMRDGGCSYLRVTDNGCGIPAQEARMAFVNHATSKISSGDELSEIMTLGFRGEALPSIAAVSRVTMTTRPKNTDAGTRITIEGGVVKDIVATGCPEGTTIVVKELFFNTPVRKGFLKKPSTEGGVVADMVARLILGNPNVSIRLISNGKTVYHSFGDGDMRHAALAIYGRETAEKILFLDETEGGLRIWGLIGVGNLQKSNRSEQFFFINGRVVRSPIMTQALESATRTLVTIGQHPMCALNLRLSAQAVDINVHPSKLEVRFRDESTVRLHVESLLSRGLFQGKMLQVKPDPEHVEERPPIMIIPPTTAQSSAHAGENERPEEQKGKTAPIVIPNLAIRSVVCDPASTIKQTVLMESPAFADDSSSTSPEQTELSFSQEEICSWSGLRIIGVFINTYILVEYQEALILIDQHAAHERIRYQEYERALHTGNASQTLLTPVILSLSPRERSVLMAHDDVLREAGYEVEPFGERDIQVRAVPYVLGKAELRPLFLELIDQLDQLKGATMDHRRDEIIQTSCKRAVKAGDHLTEAEIHALIDEMLRTEAPPTCPHGRPVLKVFKRAEIERMFKRT